MAVPNKAVSLPSTTRSYGTVEQMEGRPLFDDLVAVARQHDVGNQCGGWSAEEVAMFWNSALHTLYQMSPELRHQRANPGSV